MKNSLGWFPGLSSSTPIGSSLYASSFTGTLTSMTPFHLFKYPFDNVTKLWCISSQQEGHNNYIVYSGCNSEELNLNKNIVLVDRERQWRREREGSEGSSDPLLFGSRLGISFS